MATIYRVIGECEEGLPYMNLSKSGRYRLLINRRLQDLIESAKNRQAVSTRRIDQRFRVSHMTIKREIARNNSNTGQKCPKYTPTQSKRIPRRCRALRFHYFRNNAAIILDDEKYFIIGIK